MRTIPHLQRAVEINPHSPEARNNLGIAFASSGRLEEAVAQFERALMIDPEFVDPKRNLERIRAATTSPASPSR